MFYQDLTSTCFCTCSPGLVDFSKVDVLKELWTCVSSAYRWCLISLAKTELSGIYNKEERSKHRTMGDSKKEFDGIGQDG